MSEKAGSKRKSYSLREKMDIISELRSNPNQSTMSKKRGMPVSVISKIWKQREEIEKQFRSNSGSVKKCRRVQYDKIDQALLTWFRVRRNEDVPLNGPILLEKAKEFAEQLQISDFKGTNGWLDKWKRRHNIVFRVLSGESAAVNVEDVSNWFEEQWQPICSDYEPKDVFNCDETGLFWRVLPDRSMVFAGEKCHGGKHSKERLTVLFCTNQTGSEKQKPLVIGKSAKPRAFSRLRSPSDLPVKYYSNKKAWMTTVLFTEWLNDLDMSMRLKNRKILLLLDNCPSHPHNIQLTNVKLLYLPPNTTSISQPLDQGIIQNFKVHYRKRLLRRVIQQVEQGNSTKIDVLDAIMFTHLAWNDVTMSTINNSFRKAGFKTETPKSGDELEVEEESVNLNIYLQNPGFDQSQDLTADEYISVDEHVITSEMPTDQEILASMETGDDKNADSEDDESEVSNVQEHVTISQAYEAVEVLRRFALKQEGSDTMIQSLDKMEEFCFTRQIRKTKQPTLDDFVNKN